MGFLDRLIDQFRAAIPAAPPRPPESGPLVTPSFGEGMPDSWVDPTTGGIITRQQRDAEITAQQQQQYEQAMVQWRAQEQQRQADWAQRAAGIRERAQNLASGNQFRNTVVNNTTLASPAVRGTYNFGAARDTYLRRGVTAEDTRLYEANKFARDSANDPAYANDKKARANRFAQILTGDPNATMNEWANDGQFTEAVDNKVFGPGLFAAGVNNREQGALRSWNVPLTFRGHGSTALSNYEVSAAEAGYRTIFGQNSIPRYDTETFSPSAALYLRQGLTAAHTDTARAASLVNRARLVQVAETFGVDVNDPNLFQRLASIEVINPEDENGEPISLLQLINSKNPVEAFNPVEASAAARSEIASGLQAEEDIARAARLAVETERKKNEPSWWQTALNAILNNDAQKGFGGLGAPSLGSLVNNLSFAQEQTVQIPYASFQNARRNGYDVWDSLKFAGAAAPLNRARASVFGSEPAVLGYGSVPPDARWDVINAVNSWDKRQELGLPSPGEDFMRQFSKLAYRDSKTGKMYFFSGKGQQDVTFANIPILGQYLDAASNIPLYGNYVKWAAQVNPSGFVDAGWQVATDPTTYLAPFLKAVGATTPLSRVADRGIRAAARRVFLEGANVANDVGAAAEFDNMGRAALRSVAEGSAAGLRSGASFGEVASWLARQADEAAATLAAPGRRLTAIEVREAAAAARLRYLETSKVGQSFVKSAEQVIGRYGMSIEDLTRAFPDVERRTLVNVVNAVRAGGRDAGLDEFRRALVSGESRMELNLRRQLGILVDATIQSPGAGLGERWISNLAGGRSIPVILGRSAIKTNPRRIYRALEAAATRAGAFSSIIGSTIFERIDGLAVRLTGVEGQFPVDYARGIGDLTRDMSIEDRLQDLARIAIDPNHQILGLESVVAQLIGQLEDVPQPLMERAILNLEVIAHAIVTGPERTQEMGRILLADVLEHPRDAYRHAVEVAQRLVDETARRPARIRGLDEVVTGAARREYDAAIRETKAATERYIRSGGGREAAIRLVDSRRGEAIQKVAAAVDLVDRFARRRAILDDMAKESAARTRRLLRETIAAAEAERKEIYTARDAVKRVYQSERKRLANATVRVDADEAAIASIRTERQAIVDAREQINKVYEEQRAKNASLSNRNRAAANRELRQWRDEQTAEVNRALQENTAKRQDLTTGTSQARAEKRNANKAQRDELERWYAQQRTDIAKALEENTTRQELARIEAARALEEIGPKYHQLKNSSQSVLDAEEMATRGLVEARAELRAAGTNRNAAIRDAGAAERVLRDRTRGLTPLEAYAAVRGIDPTDISDPTIRRVVEAAQNVEIAQNMSPPPSNVDELLRFGQPVMDVIEGALNGEALVGPVRNTLDNEWGGFTRGSLLNRVSALPPVLARYFDDRIARAVANEVEDLTFIARDVERMIANPRLAQVVGEQLVRDSELAQFVGATASRLQRKGGALATVLEKPAKLALSFMESVAPEAVRFASHENPSISLMNRVEDFDRIAMAYGFDSTTRAEISRLVMQAQTPEDLYELVRQMQQVAAAHLGIGYDDYARLIDDPQTAKWRENKVAFLAHDPVRNGSGQFIEASTDNGIGTISQRSSMVSVMPAEDFRRITREWLAENADSRSVRRINSFRTDLSNLAASRAGEGLKKIHTFWKMAVVTGAPTIAIGTAAGAIYGDPNKDGGGGFWDHLKFAGLGGALGSVGGIRYIGRVAGIEERAIRYSLARGWSPKEWIPGVSKIWNSYGAELPFRNPEELVGAARHPLSHVEYNRFWSGAENEWRAIAPEQWGFVDSWSRIVNRQIQPDRYMLDNIILSNFDRTDVNWQDLAREWLQSDGGAVERKLLLGGYNGPKDLVEALSRYEQFINQYLPTEELRRLRLGTNSENVIPRSVFDEMLAAGQAPDVVHAQRTWVIPQTSKAPGGKGFFRDAWVQGKQIYPRLVMEAPTTKMNRVPMAKAIYNDEFRALVANGVDKEVARELAEERAYRMTNKVMFQLNDESRFAKKADFMFPFQQPREELLRVYGSLIANNKIRVVRASRAVALAFNNGQESGLFYEDSFGEWRMRVPGSAWLSRVFGTPNEGFDFRARDLFFLLQGNAFAASAGSTDFTANKAFDVLLGTLPTPGGPYWSMATRLAFNLYPDAFEDMKKDHPFIFNRLFPYGVTGAFMRPEATRLWESFSNSIPPWDLLVGEEDATNTFNKVQDMVLAQMLWENKDDPEYLKRIYIPGPIVDGKRGVGELTEEGKRELKKNVSGLLRMWTFIGSVTPAPTRPLMPGQQEFDSIVNTLKTQYGSDWQSKLYEFRPDIASVYMNRKTKPTDTENFDDWMKSAAYSSDNLMFHTSAYLSPNEFLSEFQLGRDRSAAYQEMTNVYNDIYFNEYDRYIAAEAATKKWADVGINFKNDYLAKKELTRIYYEVPPDKRELAIDAWRQHFERSASDYVKMLKSVRAFTPNIRMEARFFSEIDADLKERARTNPSVGMASLIAAMPVQDQEVYWQHQMAGNAYVDTYYSTLSRSGQYAADMARGRDSANAVSDWRIASTQLSKLYAENPILNAGSAIKAKSSAKEAQKALIGGDSEYFRTVSTKLAEVYAARSIAYEKKDWNLYRTLNAQATSLKEQKKAILESTYKKFPDLLAMQEDVKNVMFLMENADSKTAQAAATRLQDKMREFGIPMLSLDYEETNYRKMNTDTRAAYKDDLLSRLNLKAGDSDKLYWEQLTPFQRELMENSPLPDILIEKWKGETKGSGAGGRGGPQSSMQTDLEYAYNLMKQANKRPAGAKPPAAYAEYMKIPNSNSGAKAAFLKANPEVAEWIRLGPMANLSEIDRLIVAQIMVKYGKWEGDEMSDSEITNLAWAREQLKAWSKRTDKAKPATYDTWLAMPRGAEKAAYLESHPEVAEWVQLGPMANMPDAYQEVVRDIMYRMGEWSQTLDPLGETISQFYSLPKAKRQAFLDDHPELVAYWRSIRSPEEQRMADLTEQYFAIPDGGARKVFMSAHPELQQHFVDSRTKRYEKFMTKVAVYLGSNPSVFDDYLSKQTQVLTELQARFGSAPLIRESIKAPAGQVKASQGTSGRVRNAA